MFVLQLEHDRLRGLQLRSLAAPLQDGRGRCALPTTVLNSEQEHPVRTGLRQTPLFQRGEGKAKETERPGATFLSRGRKINLTPWTHELAYVPPTFDKCEELFVFHSVAPHVNLEREQQGEEELVLLVQASGRVLVHLKGHKLDDVGDAFAGDGALGRPDRGSEEF